MTPAPQPLDRLRRQERRRRLFDAVVASLAALALAPLVALLALLVRVTSRGPSFFVQERLGLDGRAFRLVKLRTMTMTADGSAITARSDTRITPLGRFLRRTKLDELPQLWNVLRGDMALVGPRPEVAKFVKTHPEDFSLLHLVRPGITSEASLRFRNEKDLLPEKDPETYYVARVLPEKLRLEREWLASRTGWGDLEILLRTLVLGLGLRRSVEPLFSVRPARGRLLAKAAVETTFAASAWTLATLLRFDGWPTGVDLDRLVWLVVPVSVVTVLSLHLGGMIHGIWRFFSSRDASALAFLGLPLLLLLVAGRALTPASWALVKTPYSVAAMTYFFQLAGQCAARLARSAWVARDERLEEPRPELEGRIAIFGAGRSGKAVLAELKRLAGRAVDVMAFFDDDPEKHEQMLS